MSLEIRVGEWRFGRQPKRAAQVDEQAGRPLRPADEVRAARNAVLEVVGELARVDQRLADIVNSLPRYAAFPNSRESEAAKRWIVEIYSDIGNAREDSLATAVEILSRSARAW
jgi:hypothetical protein